VFQGLGYTFENVPDRAWKPEEERESVLVLIGENLQKSEFAEAFAQCAEV
jgi:G3E family GTPase